MTSEVVPNVGGHSKYLHSTSGVILITGMTFEAIIFAVKNV